MNLYMKTALLGGVRLAAALLGAGCLATPPNVIARGMNVTWDGTRHTVEVFVCNGLDIDKPHDATGPFLVHVDADEDPVSNRDRPQVSIQSASLAHAQLTQLQGDFSPLASPNNASLSRVRSLTVHADAKNQVGEFIESDNELQSPLPDALGATTIHGPALVPNGSLRLDPGRFVGQTFTAPASGSLLGIEVRVQRCGAPGSPPPLRLVLKQGTTELATVLIPAMALAQDCNDHPPPLSGAQPGPGLFDLRDAPVPIAAGTEYAFDLHNDEATGHYRVAMARDALPGTATDYGIGIPGLDLTFRLYVAE